MKIIGHRGAPFFAAENTLDSFRVAGSLGLNIFETDVHLTKDGVVIVCHDEDLKRTFGVSLKIKDSNYNALAKYNVPTLAALMQTLSGGVTLNIEIKTDVVDYPGIEAKVLKAIAGWNGNIIISSFNYETLKRVRILDKNIKLGYLTREFSPTRAKEISAATVNMSSKRITKNIVEVARKLGMEVWIYTVNEYEEFLRMRELGADAVFTDNPYVDQPGFDKIGGVE
ncbi:glycerophosphoryl diester phosphodiesterase [Elusimicrobium simillimum]|uniref:glycerophosphodiester phosphodiesterase n=1 Tax=Elusimicrobium simillimum TaxID=3143438 RepID=UPI003C6F26C7